MFVEGIICLFANQIKTSKHATNTMKLPVFETRRLPTEFELLSVQRFLLSCRCENLKLYMWMYLLLWGKRKLQVNSVTGHRLLPLITSNPILRGLFSNTITLNGIPPADLLTFTMVQVYFEFWSSLLTLMVPRRTFKIHGNFHCTKVL